MLTGRDGHLFENLAAAGSKYEAKIGNSSYERFEPLKNVSFNWSWHKFDNGRYEIVAYLS
jgi:hypothetical protein